MEFNIAPRGSFVFVRIYLNESRVTNNIHNALITYSFTAGIAAMVTEIEIFTEDWDMRRCTETLRQH